MPLYGVGLLLLGWGLWRWRKSHWIVYDRHLELVRHGVSETVTLDSLTRARVTQGALERRFGLGTLILETESRIWSLPSLRGAVSAAGILNQAIEVLATKKRPKSARPESPLSPQQMNRMDELTSLWKQGLISDEDFERERRHFES